MNTLQETVADVSRNVYDLAQRQHSREEREALNWLTPFDIPSNSVSLLKNGKKGLMDGCRDRQNSL